MRKFIVFISILVLSIISCVKENPEMDKITCFTEIDTILINSSLIHKWELVGYIDSAEICKPDSVPEIFIEFIDSIKFRGFDGCNGYNGKYEILNENELHVISVIGTTMFCIDPIYFWEQKLLHGIKNSKSYKIKGRKLLINTDSGYNLVFKQI